MRKYIIILIILSLILTNYWVENNSCSYCFQQRLAKDVDEINFESMYIDNAKEFARHRSFNQIGDFVSKIIEVNYLNTLFWVLISTIAVFLFFNKLFRKNEAGFFAALC